MVLTDDNFATIVAAVEQGRVIYDNIRKFIKYLLTSNSAEILVMLVGPFLGLGLPLLPLQILWINLVTDGPPALALSAEPAERGRDIEKNIRKVAKPLRTSSWAEIRGRLVGPFWGLGRPRLPLQKLGINRATGGPPALAVGAEPAEGGTMRPPPHPPDESVFA